MVKTLLLDSGNDEYGRYRTVLHCDQREEALYAEYVDYNDGVYDGTYDTIELGTTLEEIKRMRDWLNRRIELIERGK